MSIASKKIMIVDDDLDLVLGLLPRLKAYGYKVVSTPDAVSAIWLAGKEQPDLIILDLGLPGGDGFSVLDRMREVPSLAAIPVIVLSAREPTGNKQRALDASASAYFQKPPDLHAFLGAIRQSLNEPTGLTTFHGD